MGTLIALEGIHALKHAVRFVAMIMDVVTDDKEQALANADLLAPELRPLIERRARVVSTAEFRSLSGQPVPTHVIAYAKRPDWDLDEALPQANRPTILLDDPRNSKNLGAVIRVAAATNAAGVLVHGPVDVCDPAAVRGAAGLQWAVPAVSSESLLTDLDPFRAQFKLVGLDADGTPFDPRSCPGPTIFAFGSERSGLSAAVRERCDQIVSLPMRPQVSSLNLATTVSAVMYLRIYAR
jgi:TrmH family RNA methyltransferase